MKKHLLFVAAVCTALLVSADPNDPQVRLVLATMDSSRNLNIQYTLDEPAIVTFDVKTNGVSIGAANLKNALRDVYRVVPATGGSHTIILPATEALPDSITRRKRAVTVTVTAWATNSPPDYMVIKLVGDDMGARTYYTAPEQLPGEGGVTNDLYKTDYLVMRRIPAAGKTFRMGSPDTEGGRNADNEILHYVSLTNDFFMSVYELTKSQYWNVIGSYPSERYFTYAPTNPVDAVTYNAFRGTTKLWPRDGHDVDDGSNLGIFRSTLNLPTLDLPTEAEWEFACRAGTLAARYDGSEYPGSGNDDVSSIAWVGADRTAPHGVGQLIPNGYGLYDMLGNVDEQCLDYFSSGSEYATRGSTVIAPQGPASSSGHVVRGTGSFWSASGSQARSAYRQTYEPSGTWMAVGFRLVCTF